MSVHQSIDRKANRTAGVLVGSWAWKTALAFLGLKLIQWLVLLIAALTGGWTGLPEIQLGAHINKNGTGAATSQPPTNTCLRPKRSESRPAR